MYYSQPEQQRLAREEQQISNGYAPDTSRLIDGHGAETTKPPPSTLATNSNAKLPPSTSAGTNTNPNAKPPPSTTPLSTTHANSNSNAKPPPSTTHANSNAKPPPSTSAAGTCTNSSNNPGYVKAPSSVDVAGLDASLAAWKAQGAKFERPTSNLSSTSNAAGHATNMPTFGNATATAAYAPTNGNSTYANSNAKPPPSTSQGNKGFVRTEREIGCQSPFAGRRDKKLGRPSPSKTDKTIGILKKGKNARDEKAQQRRWSNYVHFELKVGEEVVYSPTEGGGLCFAKILKIIEGNPTKYEIRVCPYKKGDCEQDINQSLLFDVTCERGKLAPAPKRVNGYFKLR